MQIGRTGRAACPPPVKKCLNRTAAPAWQIRHAKLHKLAGRRWQTIHCSVTDAATSRKQAAPAKLAAACYRHQTSIGPDVQLVSTVEKTGKGFLVTIMLAEEAPTGRDTPQLQWGVYRTSPAKWFHPKSVIPKGSQPTSSSGMRSPFAAASGGGHQIQLLFGADLAPLTLAFTVLLPGPEDSGAVTLRTHEGTPFTLLIGMRPGSPAILGPTIRAGSDPASDSAVNFCVRSSAAVSMALCLLRTGGAKGGYMEIALDPAVNRTGDAWHIMVEGLRDIGSLAYGWRADAADISRFYPGQIMLDPYCRAVVPVSLPDGVQTVAPNIAKVSGRTDANAAVLGSLACLLDTPEWNGMPQRQRTRVPAGDVVLEVDVPSFTEQVAGERRGKMLGVLERLQHIQACGATTVMLRPLTAGGPGLGPGGRAPLSFFAPEPSLAVGGDPLAPARELRQLVAGLHAAGLSVMMQVQYCFTAEGQPDSRTPSSLLGLDGDLYYRGNGVLNCGHAAVRRLVVDSLRHWAWDYRLDGFTFLNAEALTHDRDGTVLDAPPLAHEIAADPLLADRRILAAPGDAGLLARGGTRGFPHWAAWSERPAGFAADVVRFLAEGVGGPNLRAAAERLAGSPGTFDAAPPGTGLPGNLAAQRPAAACFNLVTALAANGRRLRKTVDDSLWNFPPHQDPGYGCSSHQDAFARSLLVAALLSRGTPCLSQDEVGEEALARFVGVLAGIRRRYLDLLQPGRLATAAPLQWHGAGPGSPPDWEGGHGYLAFSVSDGGRRALYVGLSASGGTEGAALPPPPAGTSWHAVVDTGRPTPNDAVTDGGVQLSGPDYYLQPKSALVLEAVPHPKQAAPVSSAASGSASAVGTPAAVQ